MATGPYADLERPPLREAALRRALVVPDGLWSDLRVVTETTSTNADLVAAARDGAPQGWVLVAESQSAGRGRLGRVWQSPPRAGIAVSVLLRPDSTVPACRRGWLPLLVGVALVETVRRLSELDAVLKWPNDLLIGDRKCAGILAEVVPPTGIVVGLGLNTTLRAEELPHPDATSLRLSGGACVDSDPLLRGILRGIAGWYDRWQAAAGDAQLCGLRQAYILNCGTLGREVRVELPSGQTLRGHAEDIDGEGRLVVAKAGGERVEVGAGDVLHLR